MRFAFANLTLAFLVIVIIIIKQNKNNIYYNIILFKNQSVLIIIMHLGLLTEEGYRKKKLSLELEIVEQEFLDGMTGNEGIFSLSYWVVMRVKEL